MRLGAMNWAPADKRIKKKRILSRPADFDLTAITAFHGIDELHTDPTGKVPAQSSGRIFLQGVKAYKRCLTRTANR